MSNKVPRNAVCPCGSGIKYKKCCLRDDETTRLQARSRPTLLPELSAHVSYWSDFWERYDDASLDKRLEMVHQAIDDAPSFDDNVLCTFLSTLPGPLRYAGRADEIETLLARIATRYPEAAEEEAGHIATCRLENALSLPDHDLEVAVANLAEIAVWHPDHFHRGITALLYHDLEDQVLITCRRAWPLALEADASTLLDNMGNLSISLALHDALEHLEGEWNPDAFAHEIPEYALGSLEQGAPLWNEIVHVHTTPLSLEESRKCLSGDRPSEERVLERGRFVLRFFHALHRRWQWPCTRIELVRRLLAIPRGARALDPSGCRIMDSGERPAERIHGECTRERMRGSDVDPRSPVAGVVARAMETA